MKSKTLIPALMFAALFSSLSIIPAFSGEDEGSPEGRFEERKKQMISQLDERMAALNEAKACVQGASSGEALRACHEKLKQSHEAMAEKAMDSRIERLQKRKAEMKARRASKKGE